jgi:hypothetical protein
MPMGWAPLSWRPLSMLVDMTLAATVAQPASGYALNYTLELYASVDTVRTAVIPFITAPSDTIANQQFTGKLLKGLEFHVSIVDSDIGRKMSVGTGEFQLDNSDRGYDSLYNNNTFDGRRVVLKYGQITIPGLIPSSFDTYQTLLDGIVQDVFLDASQLRGTIRDNAFKMDVPASANAYGGTGTTDGDAGLTGKRKPLAYGVVNNVTPAQINATNLVYQVHDGAVNAIPAVYDFGYALPTPGTVGPDADYASYAALIAAPSATVTTRPARRWGCSVWDRRRPAPSPVTCRAIAAGPAAMSRTRPRSCGGSLRSPRPWSIWWMRDRSSR